MTKRTKRATVTEAKEVVLYVRVSTEEQARTGLSLDAQVAAARAYCAMRGLEILETVTDAGVSAGQPLSTRPGGAQVLSLIAAGRVAGVVATKLDRIFRDCADCLQVTSDWDARGVALHLLDLGGQSIDTSSAMGRFFLTVMAGAAELERGLVSERTAATMARAKANGRRVGAIPYGQRLAADGISLERHDGEQAVIEAVRELRDAGLSLRAVSAELERRGFLSRAGKPFHTQQLLRAVGAA